MSDVAPEWLARRERIWQRVREQRAIWPVSCTNLGGECVVHISSQGVRRCAICDTKILAAVAEGTYVDRDMVLTTARSIAAARDVACFYVTGGVCELNTYTEAEATCIHCHKRFIRNERGRYQPAEWTTSS